MSRFSGRRYRRRFTSDERVIKGGHIVRPDGNAPWTLLAATGLGTILMYLFDPRTGTRRRAVIRDKVRRAARLAGKGTATTWRDVRNRACGILNEASSLLELRSVSDDVLAERVRSKLSFLVRHPSSIQVAAERGRVTLSGPILSYEVDDLLQGVRRVKGAVEVVNRLEIHEEPGQVPGLQGNPPRVPRGEPFELMQVNWSPAARATAGLTGAVLLFYGMSRRDLSGAALGLVGTAIAARAASNLPFTRLTGIAAGRRTVEAALL